MKFVETIFKICIFVGSFVVSIIALVPSWRLRTMYLSFIELIAKIILRSTYINNFVDKRAFSNPSDKEILLRKE